MEEEVIDVTSALDLSNDHELFDMSLLDSLNKLTEEIQGDFLSDKDDESEGSGDYYDSDEYTDDEDPDSGENKLFNMMDDLVMELQMELNDDVQPKEEETQNNKKESVGDNEKAEAADVATMRETVDEGTDIHEVEQNPVLLPEPAVSHQPPVDRTNMTMSDSERLEKQRRLHMQVKSLLQRVTVMAQEAGDEEIQANAAVPERRPRGDSSADKLQQLLGALSSYNSSPVAQPHSQMSEGQAKTARAMSSYTQRKRREYLLRKQAEREENVANYRPSGIAIQQPSTVRPSLSGQSSQSETLFSTPRQSKGRVPNQSEKKKRKQRTNKHKKRKPRVVSPDTSGNQRQPMNQQQQQAHDAQQSESAAPIPQQSLRALLASLLALDERLSREQMV